MNGSSSLNFLTSNSNLYMEVPNMTEAKKDESQLISAAAFVEGGIQDACGEACSICLEDFCESDPSVLTTCKHEFHFHCILEWCQRSSQCPMCWQGLSLKDPSSQELLEAVERERTIRATARSATIFLHPTLSNFEVQHLADGTNDADLEERFIQHLAAAASMGRTHHIGRREGQRSQSSLRGHPHFSVISTHPSAHSLGHVSASGGESEPATITAASPSTPLTSGGDESSRWSSQVSSVQTDEFSSSTSRPTLMQRNRQGIPSTGWSSASHSSPINQETAGPSDLQSISESLKSKFNAMSMKYKESFSKSTRGWKERLFSRSPSMSELGSEVRREVNAGIASVSRIIESLETRDNSKVGQDRVANQTADGSTTDQGNRNSSESHGRTLTDNNRPVTPCAVGSASN
ncbi:PREDICTED: E3 ubiquitin-protein ligase RHF2A-like [Fragaria vesca subsp. vesca]|uniref:E3 ubiquitin-protein ligase RHF2A-like n=1 Tax=Fragaria vesca subsp. vesca TaxID=101020 RepID=UPI0002C2F68A|nr:PREDICTED: E3 ubiquitin-protein ligase RHF2A-like [Fragaria vesca subsp. vesca]XP_011467170.1 PREDICTED: E3 ubiquitin-protein ligase RHF2A-like [Fragaria vesca subsp. vesca]XP_011467171.1 PREDICTED: E3 ubiquitin-protein ligase RHF2A-like [Fragaria vesca subsp. vesca]